MLGGLCGGGKWELTDEVDTSKLLETLKETTSRKTLSKVALEAVEVGGFAQGQLVLVVGGDLSELLNQSRVVEIEPPQLGERLGSLLRATLADVPAGSLGDEGTTNEHDDGPCKLDCDGDTVRAGVVAVLGGVVDNGGDEKSDGDGKLVATDNSTTDPFGTGLRLVKGNRHGDHADTVTSEETAGDEQGNVSGSSLKNDTNAEDDIGCDETENTTKHIRAGSTSESTEEGTGREDRHDQRGLVRSDIEIAILVPVTSAEEVPPVLHTKNTTNGTGIISGRCQSKAVWKTRDETYPKRTPPKATNNPMRIAGAAEPATPGGGLSMRPMMRE
jgi:hypothetical protein